MEKEEKLSSSSSKGMAIGGIKGAHVTKRQRASEGASSSDSSSSSNLASSEGNKSGPPAKKEDLQDSDSDSDSSNPSCSKGIESPVYQFKVTLKRSKPRIWRRIQVPRNYSFYELHEAIYKAMGWEDKHWHRFLMLPESSSPAIAYPISSSSESEEDSDEDDEVSESDKKAAKDFFSMFDPPKTPSSKEVRITQRFISPGYKAFYECSQYNFRYGWGHTVQLEKIVAAIDGTSYPRCIAGEGACPPEDSFFFIEDYNEFMAILSNPRHKEYEELVEFWKGFDPAKFDPKAVEFHDPDA